MRANNIMRSDRGPIIFSCTVITTCWTINDYIKKINPNSLQRMWQVLLNHNVTPTVLLNHLSHQSEHGSCELSILSQEFPELVKSFIGALKLGEHDGISLDNFTTALTQKPSSCPTTVKNTREALSPIYYIATDNAVLFKQVLLLLSAKKRQ